MTTAIENFKFTKDGIDFSVDVVCYDQYAFFQDEWKMTDKHEGGVTVKNDNFDRGSYKYAIPLQYSLAERTKDLLEQGNENPSATAYENAQKALQRDLNASDYGFRVLAEIDGIILLDDESMGCSFDYSYHDDCTLLEAAELCWKEHDLENESLDLAKEKAAELLSKVDSLKKIA